MQQEQQPPPLLLPLNPSFDSSSIATCNVPAFHADKHWRHQHGLTPLDEIIHDTSLRTPWVLTSSRHRLRCLKAVDPESGELIAYARWILPDEVVGDESIWSEAVVPAASGSGEVQRMKDDWASTQDVATGGARGLNLEMVRALGHLPGNEDGRIKAKYRERPFLELDYLAVREGWQGKGLGSMLVRVGIEKARDLGWNLIIMGFTEQGRELYRRLKELRRESEVRQSCEQWREGREDGCECHIEFFVWIWDENRLDNR